MDFSSDTSAPAHPRVIEALNAVNSGYQPSYGVDAGMVSLRVLLAEVFETQDFDFWICASGTASNALALSVMCSPTGAILCHQEAHIERDERGAPEFFTGGAKLQLLPGPAGQIEEDALRQALSAINREFVHETPAEVLSLTNLTECGTAYTVEQLSHYAALAHKYGLSVHLDGARFANALTHLRASPAEMSWKAGVDVLTLGLTKTGAMGCELILLFGRMREHVANLQARAKRSGHMPPKMRFLAAQAEALLQDGLWLQLAAAANQKARQLSNMLCAVDGAKLVYPVHGNEVFIALPPGVAERLSSQGAKFYPWPGGSHRFVTSWASDDESIAALQACL